MDTFTLILANCAQRLNYHGDLPGDPEQLHITDQSRAALLDVIQAVQDVQANDSSEARDRLRDVLDEAGNIHQRHQLEGADWMHAAAHVLDPVVSEENRHHYAEILAYPQRKASTADYPDT